MAKEIITKEEVKNLAELSRLEISEEEVISMQKEISDIIHYVEKLSSVTGVSTEQLLSFNKNITREDVPRENSSGEYTDKLLNLAPQRENNYLKVKKIL